MARRTGYRGNQNSFMGTLGGLMAPGDMGGSAYPFQNARGVRRAVTRGALGPRELRIARRGRLSATADGALMGGREGKRQLGGYDMSSPQMQALLQASQMRQGFGMNLGTTARQRGQMRLAAAGGDVTTLAKLLSPAWNRADETQRGSLLNMFQGVDPAALQAILTA